MEKNSIRTITLIIISIIVSLTLLCSEFALIVSTESPAKMARVNLVKGTIASKTEQIEAENYFNSLFNNGSIPFSFNLNGTEYHSFNSDFDVTRGKNAIIAKHISGVVVNVCFEYNFEYAEMEWYVTYTNTSSENSGILSSIYAIDIDYTGTRPCLNYSMGDSYKDPYLLTSHDTSLTPGVTMNFNPDCGKSTGHQRPYYRLTTEEGGVVLALGWQGRWKMQFSSSTADNGEATVSVKGGQYEFSSYLKPGEKIITPTIVLIKFSGNDKFHAINLWRRWFYDCAAFRCEDGELFDPQKVFGCSMSAIPDQNEANMLAQIKQLDVKNKNTLYWMDAGWYPLYGSISLPFAPSHWRYTGSWRVDTNRFPTKFKAIREALSDDLLLMLWFEPERVYAGTELSETPEYLLSIKSDTDQSLLNMGNLEAVQNIASRVLGILNESDIDIYRQDFNLDPYPYWVEGDRKQGGDRTGITENLYIQGLMVYYKTLLKYLDYPIDMCASGGMRNDISVMKFSINMTITDTKSTETTIHQNIRLCYNEWFSMFSGTGDADTYSTISNLSYFTGSTNNIWNKVNYLMLGDYYPLTKCSVNDDSWVAYEFFDQTYNEGYAVFIRRPNNTDSSQVFTLYGLDPDTIYRLSNLVNNNSTIIAGRELITQGLNVQLDAKSAIIYKITAIKSK